MGRYGMPYRGSKSRIAEWVLSYLPDTPIFVDLMAGGCAITDCAIKQNRFGDYLINDITGSTDMYVKALKGEFKNEKRWISRDDFFRLKDEDLYVNTCWSFNNNKKSYLYGKIYEPWKKALWYARVLNDTSLFKEMGIETDGSRRDIKEHFDEYKIKYNEYLKKHGKIGDDNLSLESLQSLQRLERLERLERPQSLELPLLKSTSIDYRAAGETITARKASYYYVDPPYKNTSGYGMDFDYDAFEEWLATIDKPCIVSEFNCPKGCIEIARKERQALNASGAASKKVSESLFIQERFKDWYDEQMKAREVFNNEI